MTCLQHSSDNTGNTKEQGTSIGSEVSGGASLLGLGGGAAGGLGVLGGGGGGSLDGSCGGGRLGLGRGGRSVEEGSLATVGVGLVLGGGGTGVVGAVVEAAREGGGAC